MIKCTTGTLILWRKKWNTRGVSKKLKAIPDVLIAESFNGMGDISGAWRILLKMKYYTGRRFIRKSVTGNIPAEKINEIIKEVRKYVFEFLEQKKKAP